MCDSIGLGDPIAPTLPADPSGKRVDVICRPVGILAKRDIVAVEALGRLMQRFGYAVHGVGGTCPLIVEQRCGGVADVVDNLLRDPSLDAPPGSRCVSEATSRLSSSACRPHFRSYRNPSHHRFPCCLGRIAAERMTVQRCEQGPVPAGTARLPRQPTRTAALRERREPACGILKTQENFAARFATKAATPSAKSGIAAQRAKFSASA